VIETAEVPRSAAGALGRDRVRPVIGDHTPAGALRERVAARHGRNIGQVAAARRQLEHVYYALRDGHVRPCSTGAPHDVPDDPPGRRCRAGHDPQQWRGRPP